jgi:[protein-PII] uridylyltransferase
MGEHAGDIFLITGSILNETRTLIHLETELLRILQTSDEVIQERAEENLHKN